MLAGQQYNSFKAEAWGKAINFSIREAAVGLSVVTKRFSGGAERMGDVVRMLAPGSATTGAYTAYSDVSFTSPGASSLSITIDQADYTAVDIDDIDRKQAENDLENAYIKESAYALIDAQDTFVFSAYAAANSGISSDHDNPVLATSLNLYATIAKAAEAMNNKNVPYPGRWLALDPIRVSNLRANPLFTMHCPSTDRATGVPHVGFCGSACGFSIYSTNNLTTLSGVLKVLGGWRGAIGFAGPRTFQRFDRRESGYATAYKTLSVYGKKVAQPDALLTVHVQT
jgi:hypothetical protein